MSVILNSPVGQLVTEKPARSRVFEQFGIDYCCGGKVTLEKACTRRKVEASVILRELELCDSTGAASEGEEWATASFAELVVNIVSVHQDYLKDELPRLALLVAKVARVHGEAHPELPLVYQIYTELKSELESHMWKEDNVLFPYCKAMETSEELPPSPFGTVGNPIQVMEAEHDEAGRALERIRELTGEYQPPLEVCNSYRAMLDRLKTLEEDLHLHIHKENNIIFPRTLQFEKERKGESA